MLLEQEKEIASTGNESLSKLGRSSLQQGVRDRFNQDSKRYVQEAAVALVTECSTSAVDVQMEGSTLPLSVPTWASFRHHPGEGTGVSITVPPGSRRREKLPPLVQDHE